MTTLLPKDADQNPIQCLRLRAGKAHSVSVTGTTARNSSAFDIATKIVSVYSTVPCFIVGGDSTVEATASDHYLPAGMMLFLSLGKDDRTDGNTHIAAIRAISDGTLYISEVE